MTQTAAVSDATGPVSWPMLRPVARAYIGSVSAAGLAVVTYVVPQITGPDAGLFAALAILTLIVSFGKVRIRIPRSGATVTACCVIDFTTLLVLGLPSATMTAAVGVWSQLSFRGRRQTPAYQTWFSVGAVALAIQASGRMYASVASHIDLPNAAGPAVALVIAATVHFLINSALVAGAIGLSTEQRVFQVWKSRFSWIWPAYVFAFAIAALAATAIEWSDLALIPFAAALFGLTYGRLKAYIEDSADSLTDPLTSLPNRRYLAAHAARELARSTREGAPISVMLIDLDSFKTINDSYGHHAGDLALREVARCLQHSIRSYDICARYGGDEFVAVLPGCDGESAARKAEILRVAVAGLACRVKPHVTIPLRISVGVSTFPVDGHTFDELLAVADARMFADKSRRPERQSEPSATPIRSQHRPAMRASERVLREQLIEAQRMATVGQLTSSVAHDFNNALTAILGYSELMSEHIGAQQPVGREVVEIAHAARRAAGLAEWLLRFSRKEGVPVSPVDVNTVVSGVEPMLRRLLGEGLSITTELRTPLLPVMSNPTQLEQVIVNLAINAKDAMPKGGALRIETSDGARHSHAAAVKRGGTAERWTVLSVSDTGVGMTPQVRARVLDPFFTTKGPGDGTGLGLAVVASIVAQSGGHIAVDSQEGRGTTFTVYLPSTERES